MTAVQYAQLIWIVSSAVGAGVCGYTLRLAIELLVEHRRREINQGREIIARGFARRNAKRTIKMIAFFVVGIMAFLRVDGWIVILVLVIGNLADTIEAILELRDDSRLENIYTQEKRKQEEAAKIGGRRKEDQRIR